MPERHYYVCNCNGTPFVWYSSNPHDTCPCGKDKHEVITDGEYRVFMNSHQPKIAELSLGNYQSAKRKQ